MLDAYKTEDEQVEALRKWWEENGKAAILGVVLGLAAIFGWREWLVHTENQAQAASELFQQSIVALNQDKFQEARDPARELLNSYDNTGYALFAHLILAHLAIEDTDYNTAQTHLETALNESGDESIKHEIRVRLARVYMAQEKYDQALAMVKGHDSKAFASVYHELQGDILTLQDQGVEARFAYQQAIEHSRSSAANLSLLTMKLNDLGQ